MFNQKGIAHLALILIALAGIGITVYLIQFTQVFKPKAAENIANIIEPVPVYNLNLPGNLPYQHLEHQQDDVTGDVFRGFRNDGVLFYAYSEQNHPADTVPVYRLVEMTSGSLEFFYTTSQPEVDLLTANLDPDKGKVYKSEGIAFYAYPPQGGPAGAIPIYRLMANNPQGYDAGLRFFASDYSLYRAAMERGNHTGEGIAFYGTHPPVESSSESGSAQVNNPVQCDAAIGLLGEHKDSCPKGYRCDLSEPGPCGYYCHFRGVCKTDTPSLWPPVSCQATHSQRNRTRTDSCPTGYHCDGSGSSACTDDEPSSACFSSGFCQPDF